MLVMEQQGVVTSVISQDGQRLGEVTSLPAASTVVLDGVRYQLTRHGATRFMLIDPVGRTVFADRTAAREVTVLEQAQELRLRRVGTFRQRWDLDHAGEVRGTCRVTTFGGTADFPADLPLPTRVFLFYIVIMTQKSAAPGNFATWA